MVQTLTQVAHITKIDIHVINSTCVATQKSFQQRKKSKQERKKKETNCNIICLGPEGH